MDFGGVGGGGGGSGGGGGDVVAAAAAGDGLFSFAKGRFDESLVYVSTCA